VVDKAKLKELLDQNMKHEEIKDILGISRARVSTLAKELGYSSTRAKNRIDVKLLAEEVANGMSFSEYHRKYGHTLAAVSKVAKKNNIISLATNNSNIDLPDSVLYEYDSGVGIHSIANRYNTNHAHVKRFLKRIKPDIVFRTHDEAVRPSLLNDKSRLEIELDTKSAGKIAIELGVKRSTVTSAIRKFGLSSKYYVVYKDIKYDILCVQLLRPSKIAMITGVPYSVIMRKLRRIGFKINKPGGMVVGSKSPLLNNKHELYDLYITQKASLRHIADLANAALGTVVYHLRRHKIPARTKDEYMQLIIDRSHGIKSTKHGIRLDSLLEQYFIDNFGEYKSISKNIKMNSNYSYAVIDFLIDNKYYEVKPKSVLYNDCKERRRMIKQFLVAKANNVDIIVWTPNGEWDRNINDNDIYYLDNWKLWFKDSNECYQWIVKYGFKPPKHTKIELYNVMLNLFKCGNDALNANISNNAPSIITKYFFEHFWYSKHNGYCAVPDAWEIGRQTVLRDSIDYLWNNKKIMNIFTLVGYISKHVQDFKFISIFKPWVARHVYQKYLPNGGVVVDPCSGWGGRFLGANDLINIKYIGYDLNRSSVDSIKNMRVFMKNNVSIEPEFYCDDSSMVKFPECDLIFTSPPYDSTELYYGIDSSKTITAPIVENIFGSGCKLVILNIPKRLVKQCNDIAERHSYYVGEILEMKTASVAGKREKTFEPIVVYRKHS
jgi:DNA-binding CsgD family transcriptional regulator